MDGEVIGRILLKYGVNYRLVMPSEKGYRNISHPVKLKSGDMINLILYKNEPGILKKIKNANKVGDFLSSNGLPARRTYSDRILSLKSGNINRYVCLYSYLPGTTIPWESYTMEYLKELGRLMAKMHIKLSELDHDGLPDVIEENIVNNDLMVKYFDNSGVAKAIKEKLGLVVVRSDHPDLLKFTKNIEHQQINHMDFVRSNILFKDKAISGILDFEKCSYGPKIFDIARSLAFLLIDCKFKTEEKIRKYFLSSGYIKRGRGVVTDDYYKGKTVLDQLVEFFVFYDFYKFLLHNPYENLSQNDHYVRTRDYLIKTGIVAKV